MQNLRHVADFVPCEQPSYSHRPGLLGSVYLLAPELQKPAPGPVLAQPVGCLLVSHNAGGRDGQRPDHAHRSGQVPGLVHRRSDHLSVYAMVSGKPATSLLSGLGPGGFRGCAATSHHPYPGADLGWQLRCAVPDFRAFQAGLPQPCCRNPDPGPMPGHPYRPIPSIS